MNETAVTVHRWTFPCADRDVASWVAKLPGALAFVYRPDAFVIGKADGAGRLLDHEDRPIDFALAYEAVIFDPSREMRWVREGEGGRITAVSEDASAFDGKRDDIATYGKPHDISYLLWGRANERAGDGWCTMHNAQVGTIHIPVEEPGDWRLAAREYFVREETHGNVAFGFQRLREFVRAEDIEP